MYSFLSPMRTQRLIIENLSMVNLKLMMKSLDKSLETLSLFNGKEDKLYSKSDIQESNRRSSDTREHQRHLLNESSTRFQVTSFDTTVEPNKDAVEDLLQMDLNVVEKEDSSDLETMILV